MKRWLLILFIALLLFTGYEISNSFALFESENAIVVNSDIGKWQIKVNDISIKDSTTFSITNVSVEENENVMEDRFAPDTRGYFDIVIDPNDTEVAIRYDLSYRDDMVVNSKISITEVSVVEGTNVIQTGPKAYSGVINLDQIEAGENIVIRFYVEWLNDEANNEVDSLYGKGEAQIEIPIEILFTQYLGEDIEEYNGWIWSQGVVKWKH